LAVAVAAAAALAVLSGGMMTEMVLPVLVLVLVAPTR
jgi:hypothetical protein